MIATSPFRHLPGERPPVLLCGRCGRELEPGAALRVTARASGCWFVICRPFVSGACFAAAGPADHNAIAYFDPEAARRLDIELDGPRPAFERETAFVRDARATGPAAI